MIEAEKITIHIEERKRNLVGKFIKEYKNGIIIKIKTRMIMIPWHYIQFVEYDVVDKIKLSENINILS